MKQTYNRDGIEVNAYVVSGNQVIPADDLGQFDVYHLDRIVDFNTYEMPNGAFAIDYYDPYIVDIDEFIDAIVNHNQDHNVVRRIAPVTDVVEVTVPNEFDKAYMGVRFYDASGNEVTPTAGSVDVSTMSDVSEGYTSKGTISATTPDTVVEVTGPLEKVKFTPSGITGAVDYRASVWQA